MATQPTTPTFTLAELAAAQQAQTIFAYSYGQDAQQLARLRSLYERKRTELTSLRAFLEESAPDVVLRAADGRQLVLRLEEKTTTNLCYQLAETLSTGLRKLEAKIVQLLHDMEEEAAEHQSEEDRTIALIEASILALCAPGDPALPQAASVWFHRTDAAENREEQLQQEHKLPESRYGKEILWHPLFPGEYVAVVSKMPLMESAEFHEGLANWCNQRRPLDPHDYAYLADCLSEALASQPTELATLRLRRALAWVEQASAALLPTAFQPEAAPALTA